MEKPKQRYVIDLTYLPIEITKNNKFKYIFNILDHFSKYLISFLIKNKLGKTIAENLENCFKKYGVPEEIGSDNGSEFVNKHVKNLLNKYKIKHIRGRPYNPHSQGTVERVHRTVRNGIICKFLENKKDFDLKFALKEVVNSYNNLKHRTILYKPKDVFYSNDINIYADVKNNTLNTSKNYRGDINIFSNNEQVLIYNNFSLKRIIKNNKVYLKKSKIKRKNVLFNICGSIIKWLKNGFYEVLIEKDYLIYELYKNDICICSVDMMKACDLNIWYKILNKN